MAKIEFTGFVEKELVSAKGEVFGLSVAEPHRRKDDNDQWQTVARTFHTVKGAAAAGFRKDDRVVVVGNQKTETYEAGGERKYRLVVWADSVDIAGQSQPAPAADSWGAGTYGDDSPF